jgi:hypothetical protein
MIMPPIQKTIMDPIPDVRTIASKAMGRLVSGIGEEHFPTLLQSLIESLQADTSSVERSGAAQALSEVLVALGVERLEAVMEDVMPLIEHRKFYVREGMLWVLAFLPGAMGAGFSVMISRSLGIIVGGLADESDAVRDVAMRAGQVS